MIDNIKDFFKEMWQFMLFFLIIGTLLIYFVAKHEKNTKAYIGSEIVIKKDTLLVTDYDGWTSSYILNNNVRVDKDFLQKNVINNNRPNGHKNTKK
jgi:hypothetical protein